VQSIIYCSESVVAFYFCSKAFADSNAAITPKAYEDAQFFPYYFTGVTTDGLEFFQLNSSIYYPNEDVFKNGFSIPGRAYLIFLLIKDSNEL
jgi:hypothetical protein